MMYRFDIVRAWKDEEHRATLSEAERSALQENPAGLVDLSWAGAEGVLRGQARGAGSLHLAGRLCAASYRRLVSAEFAPQSLLPPNGGAAAVRATIAPRRLPGAESDLPGVAGTARPAMARLPMTG